MRALLRCPRPRFQSPEEIASSKNYRLSRRALESRFSYGPDYLGARHPQYGAALRVAFHVPWLQSGKHITKTKQLISTASPMAQSAIIIWLDTVASNSTWLTSKQLVLGNVHM